MWTKEKSPNATTGIAFDSNYELPMSGAFHSEA